jgi:ketosteroid isomerase-like protein
VPQDNLALIRHAYTLLNSPGGIKRLIGFATDDFRADFTEIAPEGPVFSTIEEFRRFQEPSPWQQGLEIAPVGFHPLDDERVFVFVRVRGTGRASGVNVESRRAHLWTLRDGGISALKIYADPDSAAASFGVSE